MITEQTPKVTLGSVCSLAKGKSSSTKTNPGEYTLYLTAEQSKTSDHFDFDGRGVCVPLISALGHGKAEVKRIHYVENKFALANLLAFVKPNDERILNPKFLYYYLNSHKNELARLMKGTANVSMGIEDLKNFYIPLPNISAQENTVLTIDAITNLLILRTDCDKKMASFAPGLFYKMFGDLGKNTMGWRIAKLGEISTLIRGVSFNKEQVSQTHRADDDVPIIRAGNIQYDLELTEDLIYVNSSLVKPEQLLRKGDVAIAMSSGSANIVGKIAQIFKDWDGSVGAFCAIIRFDSQKMDPAMGAALLSSDFLKKEIRKAARGSNIKNLKRSDLVDLEVPIPPMDLQRKYASYIFETQALQEQQARSRERMEMALKSIMNTSF